MENKVVSSELQLNRYCLIVDLLSCLSISSIKRFNNSANNRSKKMMTAPNVIVALALTILAILIPYELYNYREIRRKKQLRYALLAFQSHTNPHFIKNVLQAINWFILNNEKNLASDYLCDFSNLMEDILRFSKKNFVSLSEKLAFLDLYLKLQHLRHKDKFDYISLNDATGESLKPTIYVADNINPNVFFLPPMLIHPFIENAIEHGLTPLPTKGFLSVQFLYINSKLICIVSDNGIGMEASKKAKMQLKIKRSNIGIINTRKRIEIIKKLYNINISVTIEELFPGKEFPGTKVQLEFAMPMTFDPSTGMPKQVYNV